MNVAAWYSWFPTNVGWSVIFLITWLQEYLTLVGQSCHSVITIHNEWSAGYYWKINLSMLHRQPNNPVAVYFAIMMAGCMFFLTQRVEDIQKFGADLKKVFFVFCEESVRWTPTWDETVLIIAFYKKCFTVIMYGEGHLSQCISAC